MSRLGGVALPRTARGERDGAPTSLPEPPGPRRNPRPAGGGNDSRLESSIAAAAATHPAATATSCIATAVGDSRQQGGETEAAGWPRCQGTARAGASSQTRAVFFLAMQLLLVLYGMERAETKQNPLRTQRPPAFL